MLRGSSSGDSEPISLGIRCASKITPYTSTGNVIKMDKQVQTDDDFESSWEKVKEEYLEESVCSICLENYSNVGEHQVAALKCGHIFGDICIKRWLSEARGDGGPKCPNCKSKAKPNDVKLIVPKSIKKSDPSIINEFNQKAETIRINRLRVEAEVDEINKKINNLREEFAITKKSYEAEIEEYERLEIISKEQQIAAVNSSIAAATARASTFRQRSIHQPLVAKKRFDLEPGSDSRVCAVSDMFGIIMVAQKKAFGNRQSFGLTSIGAFNFSSTEFIEIHKDQIKDIAFHPFDAMVLSASRDKTIALTDIFSSTPVMSYPIGELIWSCCWDEMNADTFYAGLGNGTVHEYDRRNNSGPKSIISTPEGVSKSPCASVNFVRVNQFTGLITTRLQNSTFSHRESDGFKTYITPASGCFMSSHFERKTAKLLYSTRPTKAQPYVKHSIWSLSLNYNGIPDDPPVHFVPDVVLKGGSQASQVMKGRLFPHPNKDESCLVFAGDQDIGGAIVWDTTNFEPVQKLGGIGYAFDVAQIKGCNSSNSSFIVLTDKCLYYYDWTLNSAF